MRLIHYEIRLAHVNGPDHDWWAEGDTRVTAEQESRKVARMTRSPEFRNVWVEDDPHDDHPADAIQGSLAGLSAWCTVPGCTWSWDYD